MLVVPTKVKCETLPELDVAAWPLIAGLSPAASTMVAAAAK